jgi:Domain of unknown function (DUF5642)
MLMERFRRTLSAFASVGAVILVIQAGVAAVWLGHHRHAVSESDAALGRVHEVAGQFPPGYQVTQTDTVVVSQEYLDKLHAPMAGALFIPGDCGGEANSGSPMPVGATMEGLRGQNGDSVITVAAMESPGAMAVTPVPPQCSAVSFVKPGYIRGFSSRVAAPAVKAALMTQGIRISATVTEEGGQAVDTVQYGYSALLDNRHIVAVTVTGVPAPGQPRDIDPAAAQRLFTAAAATIKAR